MAQTQTAPLLTLVPRDGITDSNPGIGPDGSKIPDAKPSKFALFTEDWILLQNFVTGALLLPISSGDFSQKYGEFDSAFKTSVLNCVDAFKDLHAAAEDFGNPRVLLKELQSLMGGQKPPSIYGEIVWVANHIANAANTFKFTFASLKDVLKDSMPKEERKAALIEILNGAGGLRDTAIDMEAKANALVQRLAAFAGRITESENRINHYASKSSEIYIAAAKKLSDLDKEIDQTLQEIKKQEDAYVGWTAGAAGGSAAIMIFTFGLGWPLALGWGLGAGLGGAEQARQAKERAEKLLNTQKGDQQKKLSLKLDLDGLNSRIGDIQSKVNSVSAGLKRIVGVWNNQVSVLDNIVKSTDLDEMLTYSAINQKLRILDAQNKWQQVATDTFEFTTYAFVEYRQAA